MFAKFALLIWPLITVFLFRRFSLSVAIVASVVGGYLLLPTEIGFNFPVLPTVNKDSIPAAAALMIAAIMLQFRPSGQDGPQFLPGWLPGSLIGRILIAVLLVGTFLTAEMNGDRLVYGERVLQGLGHYDAFSNIQNALVSLLPLLLARKFLAHPANQRVLLWGLCLAGLLYSLPTLYEVRMSPQLNKIVYGFFPAQWLQHLRDDGYRPIVFLHHGLWLGIFLAMSTIATAGCLRVTGAKPPRWVFFGAVIWMALTLFLSKTFGALMIAALLVPVVLFFSVRTQLVVAAVLAMTVLSYPVLRTGNLIPLQSVTQIVESIKPGRASSLIYRLANEDILLEKANQKPLFGWGGWGRNRVFDDKGRDISTTDGGWILAYGTGGWARYSGQMGLMALPILLLALRRRQLEVTAATAGLCLVLAANMIDLIPNDTLTPVTWLLAGALLGRLEVVRSASPALQAAPASAPPQPVSRYSRGAPRPAAVTPQPAASAPRARISYTRQTRPLPPADKTKT